MLVALLDVVSKVGAVELEVEGRDDLWWHVRNGLI